MPQVEVNLVESSALESNKLLVLCPVAWFQSYVDSQFRDTPHFTIPPIVQIHLPQCCLCSLLYHFLFISDVAAIFWCL